jgi:kanamycin kinase
MLQRKEQDAMPKNSESIEKYSGTNRIRHILAGGSVQQIDGGCSNSNVFRISSKAGNSFLKVQLLTEGRTLAYESRILNWLDGKVAVPEMVEYGVDGEFEYLLMTEIAGVSCSDAVPITSPAQLVFLFASGLQIVHQISIDNCPFDQTIGAKLAYAQENIEANRVDESDFDDRRQGWTKHQVYDFLVQNRPTEKDLVFGHGDYCLPNVLILDDQISGFIDLSRAGVSDRYNDLAIASRSIIHNLGEAFEQLFFDCYGLSPIDREKIEYYRALDELF